MIKGFNSIMTRHRLSIQIARVFGMVMLIMIFFQIVYFTSFYRYREARMEEANEVMANSIAVAVSIMFNDIEASSLAFAFSDNVATIISSDTGYQRYEAFLKVSELSRFVNTYNEEVSNIILISDDYDYYGLKTDIAPMLKDRIYGQFSVESLLDGKRELFFATHNSKGEQTDKLELVVFRTPIYAQTESSGIAYEEVGAMLFEMDTAGLYRIIDNNQDYSDIVITINDKYGNTMSIGESYIEDVEYIDGIVSIEDYDIDIKVSQPKNYFNEDNRYFMMWLLVNIILFAVMVLFVGYSVYKRITMPVDELLNEIKQLHVGTKKKYIEVEENEVVSVIADQINILMDINREQTRNVMNTQKRLFEAEISEKEAQFHALQLQINPHFLYNTLSCIKAKALIHDKKDIASMTTSMAKIFRYSILKEKYVTVEQEVNFINEYLKIMRERYEDRYTFTLDVDKHVYEYQTLKMVLQPIIENAIKHGLDNSREAGSVRIEVKPIDKELVYKVIDSGAGFTKERLKVVLSALEDPEITAIGESIGLVNVHKRIHDNFGDSYGIRIECKESLTHVSVVQPLVLYDESERRV